PQRPPARPQRRRHRQHPGRLRAAGALLRPLRPAPATARAPHHRPRRGVDVTVTNTWASTMADLAASFARHSGTLRGALRHALATRALLAHLPDPPQHILDVGGGAGHQALALAHAGHRVTILDSDDTMLDRARTALTEQPEDVASRVQLRHGRGEQAAT